MSENYLKKAFMEIIWVFPLLLLCMFCHRSERLDAEQKHKHELELKKWEHERQYIDQCMEEREDDKTD